MNIIEPLEILLCQHSTKHLKYYIATQTIAVLMITRLLTIPPVLPAVGAVFIGVWLR